MGLSGAVAEDIAFPSGFVFVIEGEVVVMGSWILKEMVFHLGRWLPATSPV